MKNHGRELSEEDKHNEDLIKQQRAKWGRDASTLRPRSAPHHATATEALKAAGHH